MAEASLLDKVEALLHAAQGCGFGVLEYSEASLHLSVRFDAGSALAEATPSGLPAISPSRGEINQPEASKLKRMSEPQGAIVSPGVGFFRCAHPAGGKLPAAGDEVTSGTVVALIQAGPLLQSVAAPRAGRLGRMLVADGTGVEFGAALFELL